MKAIEVTNPGTVRIVERPLPPAPGTNEVTVKVKTAGICGSDIHIYHGQNAFATYPRVVGHEFAGEIVKTGSAAAGFKAGEHVAVDPVVSCGHCYACLIGRNNVCKTVNVLGVHRDGGFCEYINVNASQVHKLPTGLSWEHAALIEPYSIAAQSAVQGRLRGDDTVLICGAGPIGLVLLEAAKIAGARVVILDIMDKRLSRAKSLGADLVINSQNNDVTREVMNFTGGNGASLIFEATGNVKVLEQCIKELAAIAGRVVVLGFGPDPAQVPPLELMRRELEIIGTRLNLNRFPEVIGWFEKGLVHHEQIISHVFDMQDVKQAFDLTEQQPGDVCKIVLKF
jgi:L-gulonate 5-dehydrogenase